MQTSASDICRAVVSAFAPDLLIRSTKPPQPVVKFLAESANLLRVPR